MSLSVLFVSTCQDCIETFRRGLIVSGLKDIRVAAGQDKLKAVLESGDRYDLAVIHVGEDFEADLHNLSAVRTSAPHTECIAVSSSNDADLAMECFKRGASDYITMPFSKDTLASRIKKVTMYKRPIGSKLRILILEDDPVSGKLMQKYLSPFGDCTIVIDGKEAIQVFEQAVVVGQIYHLLLLDIMVPEIHGKDVLRKIREIEEQHDVPKGRRSRIIMTTALSDTANVVESFKNKCDSYLVKPIDKRILIQEVSNLGFEIEAT